jgi:hypothetical protein
MTRRLFEAVLNGCLPITPATIRDATRFTPPDLHVLDGAHAAQLITNLPEQVRNGRPPNCSPHASNG